METIGKKIKKKLRKFPFEPNEVLRNSIVDKQEQLVFPLPLFFFFLAIEREWPTKNDDDDNERKQLYYIYSC